MSPFRSGPTRRRGPQILPFPRTTGAGDNGWVVTWTTYFSIHGPERSLPGLVLDPDTFGGVEVQGERVNRVQLEGLVGSDVFADGADLSEFWSVAASSLQPCAEAGGPWTEMRLNVRADSGAVAAFLVDGADALARSGVLVCAMVESIEAAAAELPYADEDPEGFDVANRELLGRVRDVLLSAAATEPGRSSLGTFRSATGLPVVMDWYGEDDPATFVTVG